MTVSRKGKHGTRAGGKNSRPAGRNRRVLHNATLKRMTGARDERPDRTRLRKEEWVINCVTRIVGTKAGRGFVAADDVASNIILDLLNAGGFTWEEEEIEAFCRKKASYMVLSYLCRREQSECDIQFDSADGKSVSISDFADCVKPQQMIAFDAGMARLCLNNIPETHRKALEILCDGGSPIDVATELGVKPWQAIQLIREGREYVSRVDPAYE